MWNGLPLLFSLLFFCTAPTLAAQEPESGSLMVPRKLRGARINDDRIGRSIPLDVRLTDHNGNPVTLGGYFSAGKRPVILTLGYYRCPMLCDLVLNGLLDAIKAMPLRLGQDYTVLSVSIHPKESVDLAGKKRAAYVRAIGQEMDVASADWRFHVGDEAQVKRLADAVGFGYRWDPRSRQFAHGAGIFVLDPRGKLNRVLYGVEFAPRQLKLALVEASQGKVGTLFDRVLLSCFHYDPDSHRYGVAIFGVTRLVGVATVLILAGVLAWLWRRERAPRKAS
ncbi:MAG: SCO family protein [Myxococcota bacterium]